MGNRDYSGDEQWLYAPAFPEDWEASDLYSLASWLNGMAFRDFEFSDSGEPIIKIAEIKNGISGQTKFTRSTYNSEYRIKAGDMLFAWSGQPETSIDVYWWLGPEGWLNQHIDKVTPSHKCDPIFFYYILKYLKPNFIAIARNKQTIGLGHVTVKDLQRMTVRIPKGDIQRAIGGILGALDDKIELNRRMNETLESLARAVFRQWFVDNEGIENWEVGDLYRIADVIYGAPFASSLFNAGGYGLPLIRIRDLSDHDPKIYSPENHPKKAIISGGDVIAGMDGEFRVHYWKGPDALLNQRMCLFKPRNGISRVFVAESVRAHLAFFERAKVGTTVIHLGKSDIDTFKVALPPRDLLTRFGKLADPILDKIIENAKESRTLANLRDTLLPKLMRGEVRIKE